MILPDTLITRLSLSLSSQGISPSQQQGIPLLKWPPPGKLLRGQFYPSGPAPKHWLHLPAQKVPSASGAQSRLRSQVLGAPCIPAHLRGARGLYHPHECSIRYSWRCPCGRGYTERSHLRAHTGMGHRVKALDCRRRTYNREVAPTGSDVQRGPVIIVPSIHVDASRHKAAE